MPNTELPRVQDLENSAEWTKLAGEINDLEKMCHLNNHRHSRKPLPKYQSCERHSVPQVQKATSVWIDDFDNHQQHRSPDRWKPKTEFERSYFFNEYHQEYEENAEKALSFSEEGERGEQASTEAEITNEKLDSYKGTRERLHEIFERNRYLRRQFFSNCTGNDFPREFEGSKKSGASGFGSTETLASQSNQSSICSIDRKPRSRVTITPELEEESLHCWKKNHLVSFGDISKNRVGLEDDQSHRISKNPLTNFESLSKNCQNLQDDDATPEVKGHLRFNEKHKPEILEVHRFGDIPKNSLSLQDNESPFNLKGTPASFGDIPKNWPRLQDNKRPHILKGTPASFGVIAKSCASLQNHESHHISRNPLTTFGDMPKNCRSLQDHESPHKSKNALTTFGDLPKNCLTLQDHTVSVSKATIKVRCHLRGDLSSPLPLDHQFPKTLDRRDAINTFYHRQQPAISRGVFPSRSSKGSHYQQCFYKSLPDLSLLQSSRQVRLMESQMDSSEKLKEHHGRSSQPDLQGLSRNMSFSQWDSTGKLKGDYGRPSQHDLKNSSWRLKEDHSPSSGRLEGDYGPSSGRLKEDHSFLESQARLHSLLCNMSSNQMESSGKFTGDHGRPSQGDLKDSTRRLKEDHGPSSGRLKEDNGPYSEKLKEDHGPSSGRLKGDHGCSPQADLKDSSGRLKEQKLPDSSRSMSLRRAKMARIPAPLDLSKVNEEFEELRVLEDVHVSLIRDYHRPLNGLPTVIQDDCSDDVPRNLGLCCSLSEGCAEKCVCTSLEELQSPQLVYLSDSSIVDPRHRSRIRDRIDQVNSTSATSAGIGTTLTSVYGPIPYKSPRRYVEGEVTIHYRSPVRTEAKEPLSEEELSRRSAENMRRVYQEERRRKYLQELHDIDSRRHTDNFIPSQKSPIPLNRYDDFVDDLSHRSRSQDQTPEPRLVARALYNFIGQSSRELNFRRGDVIFVRRQVDKNWYEGEHNAMIGLFPSNYVEILPYDGMRTTPKKSYEGQARAKFNFVAQTNLELSLAKGEIVVLTRRIDENWYEGRIGNRKGIFPISYVEVLTEPGHRSETPTQSKPVASPAAHSLLANGSAGGKMSMGPHHYTPSIPLNINTTQPHYNSLPRMGGSKLHVTQLSEALHINTHSEQIPYRALYPYRPQNEDELELKEGDMVYVMEKCDDGWYVGSSQRTGYFGTFPGNYVERL